MGKVRKILFPTPMLRKQAGQMRKLLGLWNNNDRNKGLLSNEKVAPIPIVKEGKPNFLANTHGLNQKYVTRRQIVLNRHFTEIVSDVLANSLKTQLNSIGVTVTSIETKAWNKGVNVFYSTNKPFDAKLHQDLNSLTTQLRHAITERRLIGRTPMLNFVYDSIAQWNTNLTSLLKEAKISEQPKVVDLTKTFPSDVQNSQKWIGVKSRLMPSQFSAPSDMNNVTLGLDYPSLYNQIASKLEFGRGESSRMISDSSLASITKPLLRVPPDQSSTNEEDPARRIVQMKNFLISQKKKAEHLARKRRKEELLYRDTYKWDLPEEANS